MYLYRHIRLDINKPFYIGVGSDDGGKYKRAHNTTHRNKEWKDIFNSTPYEIEILLEDLTKEEAWKKEEFFISYYGRKKDGGPLVNISSGGQMGKTGVKDNKETRKKKSLASLNKPKSEQWKISQSLSRKGKKRGYCWWLDNNIERNKKISQSKVNQPSSKRTPIYQLDLKRNIIREWESITQAQKVLNIKGIGNVLTNRAKTCGGFTFKYKNKK
jgi:hypothetical protein